MADKLIRLDGVKWHDKLGPHQLLNLRIQHLEALCPVHDLRMAIQGSYITGNILICSEGRGHQIKLPRAYKEQRTYAINKIDAEAFSRLPVINLDDEAIPVAKEDLKDTDYWVKAKVTESKSGTRLIVWAGSKKDKNKAQLFVEPELKRMSFDQNDNHPNEVFAKVEATFKDGVHTSIKKD